MNKVTCEKTNQSGTAIATIKRRSGGPWTIFIEAKNGEQVCVKNAKCLNVILYAAESPDTLPELLVKAGKRAVFCPKPFPSKPPNGSGAGTRRKRKRRPTIVVTKPEARDGDDKPVQNQDRLVDGSLSRTRDMVAHFCNPHQERTLER